MLEYAGLFSVIVFLVSPLLCYFLVKKFARTNRYAASLYNLVKNKAVLFTMLYFFVVSAFIAIVSPIFVEHVKEGLSLKTLEETLNLSGIILMLLALPIVTVSYLMDASIKKIGQYEHFLGGYIDPTTGHPNISLRYDTFANVVAELQDPKKIGVEIGNTFAETIIKKKSSCDSDELVQKWTEADEKAGWCSRVECDPDTKSVKIINSFALRRVNEGDKYPKDKNAKLCKFLIGYSQGVISKGLGKSVEMNDCLKNCLGENKEKVCAINWVESK